MTLIDTAADGFRGPCWGWDTDDTGTTLVAYVPRPGPGCSLAVTESAEVVTIELRMVHPPGDGDGAGKPFAIRVPLAAPVGRRIVLDAFSGSALPRWAGGPPAPRSDKVTSQEHLLDEILALHGPDAITTNGIWIDHEGTVVIEVLPEHEAATRDRLAARYGTRVRVVVGHPGVAGTGSSARRETSH